MSFFRWLWSLVGGAPAPAPDLVLEVQKETVKACRFLPQAASVAQIFGAMTGQSRAAATAVGIAGMICKAVTAAKSIGTIYDGTPLTPIVEVDGIPIEVEGTYVDK